MKLKELEGEDRAFNGICHDCGKHVEITAKREEDGTIIIEGGAVFQVHQGQEKLLFFKCDECFRDDHTLRNWRPCEVYSRVVGYLRPVQQYNKGKKVEYEMRKEFTNTKGL